MALIGSPYRFDGEAPSVAELHERAEQLGGLPIKVTSYTSGADEFEFDFLPGTVSVDRSPDEVFLSSFAGEAPVLLDLLQVVLEEFGGRVRGRRERAELELPLTESAVESATAAYRKKLNRLARRAGLMIAGLVASGLGLAGLLIWAIWRLLAG